MEWGELWAQKTGRVRTGQKIQGTALFPVSSAGGADWEQAGFPDDLNWKQAV